MVRRLANVLKRSAGDFALLHEYRPRGHQYSLLRRMIRSACAFSSSPGEKGVERICALSEELEFCCLISGYTDRCTACPLPKDFEFLPYQTKSDEFLDALSILDIEDASKMTVKSLKAAFRKQALLHHPDQNPGCPQAEERFKAVFASYATLLGQFAE